MPYKYFLYPFANAGDVATVPNAVQPDGSVSYAQGFGADYEADPALDPDAKDMPRTKTNQILLDITTAIQQYQQHGTPPFITTSDNGGTPYAYSKYDQVRYNDGGGIKIFQSLVDGNTDLPTVTTSWVQIDASMLRKSLTADTNFYVRTDGSNANTGLANTAGGAWQTLQYAYDFIANNYDLRGFTATVNVGDGAYTTGINATHPNTTGFIKFVGNTATPNNCLVTVTSSNCFTASLGSIFYIKGFGMQTTTNGGAIATSSGGKIIVDGNVQFNALAAGNIHLFSSGSGSFIQVNSDYRINGGAAYHMLADYGAFIETANSLTTTILGNPNFTSFFAYASNGASIKETGATFTGTATGTRYRAQFNGIINTNSAGNPNYFPGNAAGSSLTGGQYT